MDETLIHCNDTLDKPSDVVLQVKLSTGENVQVYFFIIGWN